MARIERERLEETGIEESSWSSPSKLSTKLREVAGRAHRALKAGARSEDHPQDIGDDLGDLRVQVARLQQKIHKRRLGVLMPWVDALRQQVERQFGDNKRTGS
jgi:hypothetical protein